MAVENFFISTAFRIGDFVKYFSYPFFKVVSMYATNGNERASDLVAGSMAATTYGGLTSYYTGKELENFDRVARQAYAAEKGVDPEKVKMSDYLDSDNPIVRARAKLGADLMKLRYPASALPLVPSAIDHVLDHVPEAERATLQSWRQFKPGKGTPPISHLINMNKVDNHIVYAAFAALWLYEQFGVRKTGIYDVAKVQETKEDVARKIDANDLIGIYNRGREDGNKEMILNKEDRNALWPVLERLADKMNTSSRLDIPEAVYLLGLDKINPFEKDADGKEIKDSKGQRKLCKKALDRAYAEIDHVEQVGLAGIAEEKRKERGLARQEEKPRTPASWQDRLDRRLLDAQFGFSHRFTANMDKPSEEISARDPVR